MWFLALATSHWTPLFVQGDDRGTRYTRIQKSGAISGGGALAAFPQVPVPSPISPGTPPVGETTAAEKRGHCRVVTLPDRRMNRETDYCTAEGPQVLRSHVFRQGMFYQVLCVALPCRVAEGPGNFDTRAPCGLLLDHRKVRASAPRLCACAVHQQTEGVTITEKLTRPHS
ncbi:hypothetical protein H4582DRAFT_811256 [Lactarius indigo]|nr:hypothetical protein H4582DRAFT_811256 [Lactarius indigo]